MRRILRQRAAIGLLAVVLCLVIAGCASWNQLTKDEKVRVVLDFMERETTNLRDGVMKWARELPQTTPEQLDRKRQIYRRLNSEVLPGFKKVYQTIDDIASKAYLGGIDQLTAEYIVMTALERVRALAYEIGYRGET